MSASLLAMPPMATSLSPGTDSSRWEYASTYWSSSDQLIPFLTVEVWKHICWDRASDIAMQSSVLLFRSGNESP